MTLSAIDLYNLLPAIYRVRDAAQSGGAAPGGALYQLVEILAEQLGLVEDDIARLYDNWFVETADEWVTAYIGDLLGVRGLHQIEAAGFTQRSRVANTLGYRRRKGTATMLEQLARDTTLWNARAVEYFQLLGTTQYLNHLRPTNVRTPDLRQVRALELLDTPFDTIAHTADVRHIDNGRAKHNIPNIGIFLWRLQNYALRDATPLPADPGSNDGRYFFNSIGLDAPLFSEPVTETSITHLAEVTDVPDAIRPLLFHLDLQEYLQNNAALAPARRERNSAYYGPEASLALTVNGHNLTGLDVQCMDLGEWARPPVRVSGLLTGSLPAVLSLTAATPEVNIAIGGSGPFTAALAQVPTTPSEAREALETAIWAAQPLAHAFRGVRVILVGDRLLVLPGLPGLTVTFSATGADPTSAGELLLDTAAGVDAALSTRLKPFPALTSGRLMLQIGALGPFPVILSTSPKTLAQARAFLETAIQSANAAAEFAQATVTIVDDCLLVLPGGAGGLVTFTAEAQDPGSVYLLGLANRIGVDVQLGRLVFPLGMIPASVAVSYNYGFSGDLGGGPYDRRLVRHGPGAAEPGIYENSVAVMERTGSAAPSFAQKLLVPDAFPSLTAALAAWNPTGGPAVIQVSDSRTYKEDLAILMGTDDLVIQARNKQRPTLIGSLTIQGADKARLQINGLLVAGSIHIADDASLRQLDLIHTTLVCKPRSYAVSANPTNVNLQVNLGFSLCGPLLLPAAAEGLDAQDSLIISSTLGSPIGGPARAWPALLSAKLANSFTLTSATPTVKVFIGSEGPLTVRLSSKPGQPATARKLLEQALRAASDSPAFSQAQVLTHDNRLIVLPGEMAPVRIENAGADPTAEQLGLSLTQSRSLFALVGGRVDPFNLTAASPQMRVSWLSPAGPQEKTIILAPKPTDLPAARQALEDGLHAAAAGELILSAAMVAIDAGGQRLVVLPGSDDAALVLTPQAAGGQATAFELGLESEVCAIAGSSAGDRPGPQTSLQRCTLLGAVHVQELVLASECLFNDIVTSDRRQGRGERDCVRFCYLPDGSRTPPRYRCQPELAVARALEDAQRLSKTKISQAAQDTIRQHVLERLVPTFTSTRYGDPGFAQLGSICPVEIKTGAADGSEMGAYNFLKQPQREANLLSSLDEYLRFGLEAGIFYAS